VQEGKNAEHLAQLLRDHKDVVVPTIHWKLTTPKVLVMQFVQGVQVRRACAVAARCCVRRCRERVGICDAPQVNDVAELRRIGLDPLQVAESVTRVFGEMTFCHGFVHCDPHAGR
jgi:aarF domain-containing kinase